MNHDEHHEQAALFAWAVMQQARHPELALMYAIPNAARRSPRQGAWMKAEGMKAGVPDVHLPVPVRGYCGLWIEMKAGRNKPTAEQKRRMEDLRSVGHRCVVCYSWDEARREIEKYLALGVNPWPGEAA